MAGSFDEWASKLGGEGEAPPTDKPAAAPPPAPTAAPPAKRRRSFEDWANELPAPPPPPPPPPPGVMSRAWDATKEAGRAVLDSLTTDQADTPKAAEGQPRRGTIPPRRPAPGLEAPPTAEQPAAAAPPPAQAPMQASGLEQRYPASIPDMPAPAATEQRYPPAGVDMPPVGLRPPGPAGVDQRGFMPDGLTLGQSGQDVLGGVEQVKGLAAGAAAFGGAVDWRAATGVLADLDAVDAGQPPTNTAQPVARPYGPPAMGAPSPVVVQYQQGTPEQRAQIRQSLTGALARDQEFIATAAKMVKGYAEEQQRLSGKLPDFTDIRTVQEAGQWAVRNGLATAPTMAVSMLSAAIAGVPGLVASSLGMAAGDMTGERIDAANSGYDPARFQNPDRRDAATAAQPGLTTRKLADAVPATAALMAPYAALDLMGGPAAAIAKGQVKGMAAKGVKELAKETGKETVGEMGNEAGQEVINVYAAMLANERPFEWKTEDSKRVFNAAMVGGMMGAGGAGVNAASDAARNVVQDARVQRELGKRAEAGDIEAALMLTLAKKGGISARELVSASHEQLDELAARYGAPPDAVAAAKKQAAGMAASDVPGFFTRFMRALDRRKMLGTGLPPMDPPKPLGGEPPEESPTAKTPATPGDRTTSPGAAAPSPTITTPVDEAAHQAATSPTNDRPEPTQPQKEAGNYKLGHIKVGGLDISVENPQGSVRRGVDKDGKAWETPMQHHYGYVRGTTANDGDKLDVFVVPGIPEDFGGSVFVVDQVDPATGKLDEHKAILGADSIEEAEEIYRANYPADWKGLGAITELPLDAFKAWARDGDKSQFLGNPDEQRDLPASAPVAPGPAAGGAPVDGRGGRAVGADAPQPDGAGGRPAGAPAAGLQPPVAAQPGDAPDGALNAPPISDNGAAPGPSGSPGFVGGPSVGGPVSPAPAQPDTQPQPRPADNAPPGGSATTAKGGNTGAKPGAGNAETPSRVIARAGRSPTKAAPVELRTNPDGTLTPFLNGEPLQAAGKPITLAADTTDQEAKRRIRESGAIDKLTNFYPVGAEADQAQKDAQKALDDIKAIMGGTPPAPPAAAAPTQQPAVDAVPAAAPAAAAPAPKPAEPKRGEIGMKLGEGEIVLTASGRKTTPFPKVKVDTDRKAGNTVKAVDRWLMQNALDEAESRGDEFNAQTFRASLDRPQQADKDAAEEYLFGEQPPVLPPITKPLAAAPAPEPAPAPAPPPKIDKRARMARAKQRVNVLEDSLLTALAKLGGIRRDAVAKEFGLKPEELQFTVMRGGLKGFPFRKNGGMGLDDSMALLAELGYFPGVSDEDMRTTFEEWIYDELGGSPHFTPEGEMAQEARRRADDAQQADADAEAQRRAEADFGPDDLALPPIDVYDPQLDVDLGALDGFTVDELDDAGFADLMAEEQAAVAALFAEAEALGLDLEGMRENAAQLTDGQPDEAYHAQLQDLIAEAVAQAREAAGRAGPEAARGSGAGDGQPAGGQGGQEEGQAPPLDLAAQSADDLKAKTEREGNAAALDQRQQIDREREGFTLQMQTPPEQRRDTTSDLFGGPTPADEQAAATTDGWHSRGGRVYDLMAGGVLQARIEHTGHPTALRPYYFTAGALIERVHPELAERKFSTLENAKEAADSFAKGVLPSYASDLSALFPTLEQLRADLRKIEGEILAAAPKKFSQGGGDIEGAVAHPSTPGGLKIVRSAIKERIRTLAAEKAADAKAELPDPEGLVNIPADEGAFIDALAGVAGVAPGDFDHTDAAAQAQGESQVMRELFAPTDITPVSLPRADKNNPKPAGVEWVSLEQAKAQLEEWKAEARRQGRELAGRNANLGVISMFDVSGIMSEPWALAGYNVAAYDLQTGTDIRDFNAFNLLETHGNDNVVAILAQPPCTDFTSSGAHAWKKKDADGRTEQSNELVRQVLRTVDLLKPAIWMLENPVGRIRKLNKLPVPLLTMDPWHFGDPYTKRTQLFGRFNPELPTAMVEPIEGSKMLNMSSSAKYERSLTSEYFAYAFFMANNFEAMGPVGRLAFTFAGIERALFRRAVAAGNTEDDIRSAIEDSYNDSDLETVREELERLAGDGDGESDAGDGPTPPAPPPAGGPRPGQVLSRPAPGERNEHGVYTPTETLEFTASSKQGHVKINLSPSKVTGGWLVAVDVTYPTGEGGSGPIVDHDATPMRTREEAIREGVAIVRRQFFSRMGSYGTAAKAKFRNQAEKWLDAQLAQLDGAQAAPPQRSTKMPPRKKARPGPPKIVAPPLPDAPIDAFFNGLSLDALNTLAAKLGVRPATAERFRGRVETEIEKAEPDLAKLQAMAGVLPLEGGANAGIVNGRPRAPDVQPKECLLLMPCGASKLDKPARADEIYTGPMWQTWRTRQVPGATPELAILSAEHGMLRPGREIEPYERQMTAERADELQGQSLQLARDLATGRAKDAPQLRDVQIVGGKEYRRVMVAVVAVLQQQGVVAKDASIREIAGEIGEQRQQLGQYLEGFAPTTSPTPPTSPTPGRNPALVALRKRVSVLESLRRCLS